MASSPPKPRTSKPLTALERVKRIWSIVNSINDDDDAPVWRNTLKTLQKDIEDYNPPRWAKPDCTEALSKTSQAVHELLDRICDICYVAMKGSGWKRVGPTGFNTDLESQARKMILAHVCYVQKWIETVSGGARDSDQRILAQIEVNHRYSDLSQHMDSIRWTLRIREVHERTPTPADTITSDGTSSISHVPESPRGPDSSHALSSGLNSSSPPLLSSSSARSTQVLSSPPAMASPGSIDSPPLSRYHAEYLNPLAMLTGAGWEQARQDHSSSDQE